MSDRELLELIYQDKVKGFSLLVDKYSSLVYKIVSDVILPVGTREDAEECTSDTFVALYNNLESIDLEKGSIKGYLGVIAKRRAINLYNTLKRHETVEMPEYMQLSEKEAVDYDTRQALLGAVKALGEPDSIIVTRRYLLGQTAKEISPYVQLSPEAVQKRLQRAVERLRTMLGGVING